MRKPTLSHRTKYTTSCDSHVTEVISLVCFYTNEHENMSSKYITALAHDT